MDAVAAGKLRTGREVFLERTLFQWGGRDGAIQMHALLHAWSREVGRTHDQAQKAKHDAELEQLRVLREVQVKDVLRKLQGENLLFNAHIMLRSWKDSLDERKLGKMTQQAEYFRLCIGLTFDASCLPLSPVWIHRQLVSCFRLGGRRPSANAGCLT